MPRLHTDLVKVDHALDVPAVENCNGMMVYLGLGMRWNTNNASSSLPIDTFSKIMVKGKARIV